MKKQTKSTKNIFTRWYMILFYFLLSLAFFMIVNITPVSENLEIEELGTSLQVTDDMERLFVIEEQTKAFEREVGVGTIITTLNDIQLIK